jgi:predicted short-subunit dehydrogenase-like oxidoreductase (DUF2520 family)
VIIGAGNVATHISRNLYSVGHTISCIYSRTRESASRLAEEFGSMGTAVPKEVPDGTDFFIVCVPDKTVQEVVLKFRDRKGIWLHTSGALSLAVFEGHQSQCGVLYPLQTLTRQRTVEKEEIPLLVEGSTPAVTDAIHELASSMTGNVHIMSAASRLMIHLAAVFANNFSNHMVNVAQQILDEQGIDVKLMDPLLKETFSKISEIGAAGTQTGPASRGDEETMKKHLELLLEHPEWKNLYTFISRDIGRFRKD